MTCEEKVTAFLTYFCHAGMSSFGVQNTPQLSGQRLAQPAVAQQSPEGLIGPSSTAKANFIQMSCSTSFFQWETKCVPLFSTHTRRDWFSRMALKNELITTRNRSSSLMPWFSFVLVVTTRFSTLKLLRTLALWKQFLLPRAEKNYGDVNFMWSFYPTVLS